MAESNQNRHQSTWYRTVVGGLTLLVVLLFVGLHVYRGLTAESITDITSIQNFILAFVVLGGVILSFTRYWHPVVYLISALFVGTLTVFWGLRRPVTASLEATRLFLGSVLTLLLIYLFYRSKVRSERGRS